ncbi:MAG TPA: hypothetical protein VEP30_13020 [Chthoniobacterales bacterium]|nr:hypothetical protein [Chthoniobacterales bacterium]
MRTTWIYISILAVMAGVWARADDELPKRLDFARYKGMLDHSPFAVASAVAPAATPSACKDLFIANAAKSADGDMVTVGSTVDKEFKKYLTTKNPVDGYSIANIEWSDKVGETKVTISKDGQFCTLTFNQALLSQPVPNRPAPGIMPSLPAPAQQPGLQRPGPTPLPPVPTPHVRGVIPRNPQPPVPPPPSGFGQPKKQPDRDDDGTLPQGL